MIKKIPLGQSTDYPRCFDPELLFPIARSEARSAIGIGRELPFIGYDEWNLYELAWLDSNSSPQMAMAQIKVPCDSEFIIESKSLKLYSNSLFYKEFKDLNSLKNQISEDLRSALKSPVQITILPLDDSFDTDSSEFLSLDSYFATVSTEIDASKISIVEGENRQQAYVTHRFRSLCPVTGQPDWASIYLSLCGKEINQADLMAYFLAYSEHQGFHENCVERMYLDLSRHINPDSICIAARYTRRGGIDINPVRASSEAILHMPGRLPRQ